MLLPTRGEGLPRVILEAMAEGLPVISTRVCGIPEILEDEYLFDIADTEGMADKIYSILNDPQEMNRISERNLKESYKYARSKLQKKRNDFYTKVRQMEAAD